MTNPAAASNRMAPARNAAVRIGIETIIVDLVLDVVGLAGDIFEFL